MLNTVTYIVSNYFLQKFDETIGLYSRSLFKIVQQAQPSYDDIKRQISASNPMGLSVDFDEEDY